MATPLDRDAIRTASCLATVPCTSWSSTIAGIHASWRPTPTKNHGTSPHQGFPRGTHRSPKSASSEPSPFRRATTASQMTIVPSCEMTSAASSVGLVCTPTNALATTETRSPANQAATTSPIPQVIRGRRAGGAGTAGSGADVGLTGRPAPRSAPAHDTGAGNRRFRPRSGSARGLFFGPIWLCVSSGLLPAVAWSDRGGQSEAARQESGPTHEPSSKRPRPRERSRSPRPHAQRPAAVSSGWSASGRWDASGRSPRFAAW